MNRLEQECAGCHRGGDVEQKLEGRVRACQAERGRRRCPGPEAWCFYITRNPGLSCSSSVSREGWEMEQER
jgi:hypothetical protein